MILLSLISQIIFLMGALVHIYRCGVSIIQWLGIPVKTQTDGFYDVYWLMACIAALRFLQAYEQGGLPEWP